MIEKTEPVAEYISAKAGKFVEDVKNKLLRDLTRKRMKKTMRMIL